jgi:hypothetical protein
MRWGGCHGQVDPVAVYDVVQRGPSGAKGLNRVGPVALARPCSSLQNCFSNFQTKLDL